MLADAPALLLDEPTAALDPDGLCAFYGLIERRRAEGRSVLFTSHQLGDAERLADRFAVAERLADRGHLRVRISDCPDDLLADARRLSPDAKWVPSLRELIMPGPASGRPVLLDAIRRFDVTIEGLTAEEGRLDSLYRELVREEDR
jgi:Cu-processing system ATP-binding protein